MARIRKLIGKGKKKKHTGKKHYRRKSSKR